jgi:hypothetical protein
MDVLGIRVVLRIVVGVLKLIIVLGFTASYGIVANLIKIDMFVLLYIGYSKESLLPEQLHHKPNFILLPSIPNHNPFLLKFPYHLLSSNRLIQYFISNLLRIEIKQVRIGQ